MIYNFAKLIDQTKDFDNPVVKRLWVGDYWKDEVEQYFGVYDDGKLIAYYTHEEQADSGMENRVKEYTTWNDEDRHLVERDIERTNGLVSPAQTDTCSNCGEKL